MLQSRVWNLYLYGQLGFRCVELQCGVWNRGVWNLRSNRISVCRITVLCLESLLVRSNRISVCRMTVWCLESLLVRSNRISVCRITGVVSGISIGTVK